MTDAPRRPRLPEPDSASRRSHADRRRCWREPHCRTKVAEPLGLTPERAALGVFDVVNANMIGGIRVGVGRAGPRSARLQLVAGGGATSAHAGRLAADLGIRTVLIPRVASGLCAFGEAVADVKHTYLASYTVRLPELDPQRLDDMFLELERQGREDLYAEGFADTDIDVERSVDMKYVDQVHECRVEIPRFTIEATTIAEIEDAFHRRHEALYTYCERDNVAELINVEVNVFGRSPRACADPTLGGNRLAATRRPTPQRAASVRRVRRVSPDTRLRRAALRVGDIVDGPAVVEEESTTIVVFPRSTLALARPDVYVMTVS